MQRPEGQELEEAFALPPATGIAVPKTGLSDGNLANTFSYGITHLG